ncbi:hypothetical protein NUW58_g2206 [Xylaria curta]|uniref:Uncharacterized protein n=2 Tax=Xylaria curta TaxID=42375 RepID=A0ACC1PIN7_9PEZI|nr:hypothetical protein NUW58_g2428 [Xylaria curta]KAJ2992320.1 hypothetical protein NUW58_g2206 [Xylaria curta]
MIENRQNRMIFQSLAYSSSSAVQCHPFCHDALREAKAEGRTSNYGCVGFFPLRTDIPWERIPGTSTIVALGKCTCDNYLLNTIADLVIDTFPIIAETGRYIILPAFKTLLNIGLQLIPGAGKALDARLYAAMTAAQIAAYAYPPEEYPEDAFSWWLSPCGGADLVPDDIKKAFDILSNVADGVSSFKPPKNIRKGSGKKGDAANPVNLSKPKARTGKGSNSTGSSSSSTKKKKCAGASYVKRPRPAVTIWYDEHKGASWMDMTNREERCCDADEYPPAYLLDDTSPAFVNSGKNAQGQSIRYLASGENRGAGSMWKGACFSPHVAALSESEFKSKVNERSIKESSEQH